MNVQLVIPMAGQGSRFLKMKQSRRKPFIDILGKPMFIRVLDNLKSKLISSTQLVILPQDESEVLNFKNKFQAELNYNIITHETEGAACTVLQGLEALDVHSSLLVANADQIIDFSTEHFLNHCLESQLDGVILTMFANTDEWSYLKTDAEGLVTEVAEKKVISDQATVGVYYFKKTGDFITAAKQMINKNDRTNNEFYVAPVYNYLIAQNKKIGVYSIGSVHEKMFGLGTPEHLEKSVLNPRFREVINHDTPSCS
jgi:UDP-N-acetylglucosamine diphosphorylase / glucose-1-phosphate thymidylyltransferase / UDP-N-acetylgalactosamine diphosphorylase / glucosamine-1-phosphate N-acetyltransferase / galactosamine-1-phosphate N-acetyltransferase